MRLAHPDWKFVLEFRENETPVLVIEDPRRLRQAAGELARQADGEEGRFVLSKDWEPIEIEKNLRVMTDVFGLDVNERKSLSALHRELHRAAEGEKYFLKTAELKTQLARWMAALEMETPYALEYEDANVPALLKALDVRFENPPSELTERLAQWMRIQTAFLSVRCIVCVNLRALFDVEELRQLYQCARYEKVHLLMLENRAEGKIDPGERFFVIDKDLCEIYDE